MRGLCKSKAPVVKPPEPPPAPPAPVDPAALEGAPRDAWAYRLAIAGVSLALVAFLIGGAIVGASGHVKDMVQEYWSIGSALSGALVAILVPSPRQKQASRAPGEKTGPSWAEPEVVILAVIFIASVVLQATVKSIDPAQLRTVAAASAGALVGLLAPSPVKTPPPPKA